MEKSVELAGEVAALRMRLRASLEKVVVGLEDASDLLLMALLAGGHVLLEGVPGTAKTTLCRTFSQSLGMQFERVQFTPDLLPSDVTGTQVLDRRTSEFALRKGPIFCQVLLADELNRAPARTQSSLLEAMQEQQVTIEGQTLALPAPFFVLATQNPIEQEGVYRLPEAQLDRFLFRVEIGYPTKEDEVGMLRLHSRQVSDVSPVTSAEEILTIRRAIEDVYVADEIREYVVDLIRSSRNHPDLALGGSPRAAISLLKAARAHCLLQSRGFVTHEDVQAIALPVLGHRIIMSPEAEIEGRRPQQIVDSLIAKVPVLTNAELRFRQQGT